MQGGWLLGQIGVGVGRRSGLRRGRRSFGSVMGVSGRVFGMERLIW